MTTLLGHAVDTEQVLAIATAAAVLAANQVDPVTSPEWGELRRALTAAGLPMNYTEAHEGAR